MVLQGFTIGELKTRLPVIQGGMGVGVSLSGLAGAVAGQGGIGIISAAQPGYNFEGFEKNPLKANLEALAYHIGEAKKKVVDGLVGVNIMCALTSYAEYVKSAIDNGADLIISGAGLPLQLPELTKNTAIKIAPIVSSLKACKVLLKSWDKKHQQTGDMIIVEGPKAGGHLGFQRDEILEAENNFDTEVSSIVEFVKEYEQKYEKKIPVVFAGGVYDRDDIEHYVNLGCAGVQMSTRFVATEECDAAEEFKQAYVNASSEDVVIVQSPVGMPGRALNNAFIQRVDKGEKVKIPKCYKCLNHCDMAKIPYCITKALVNSASGNVDEGLIFCGDTVGRINGISTVPEIMGELFPDIIKK